METVLPSASTNSPISVLPPLGYQALGSARMVSKEDTTVRLHAGTATVEVTALAPDLFRVGLFPHGRLVHYPSEAVVVQSWNPGTISIVESAETVTIATEMATAHLSLNPLRIGFTDAVGRSFANDDPKLGMGYFPLAEHAPVVDLLNPFGTLGTPARLYKQHAPNEFYFGCGERTGTLNKTETHQVFWNIDPPPGQTALHSNLYVSIPFILGMNEGQAWGLFLDSAGRVEFDLAKEQKDLSWFSTACGDLVYYVFCGPTPQAVLSRYTELTGHTPLPPLWSLGNGQSRFSYETADEVRAIARSFRERDIPCDTIYLDIDKMDGYRVFTWHPDRFPDPAGLIAELSEQGFHVVCIVDAGVKVDVNYPIYLDGKERDLYCKTQDGDDFQNVVWPGLCVFPDFTNPAARAWWGAQHQSLLDIGVRGFWCDMNEPSLFIPKNSTMPPDVLHPGGGHSRLHLQVHNAYGQLMVQGVREGLLKLRPEQRPFIISRSGYAGIQRHALLWTGDNSSSWEHLTMSVSQLLNLGLSGVGWSGVDIGGFFGDSNGELVARWTEFGIFQPFCRNHTDKGTAYQEPWIFGEPYESVCRAMLKLRQRLLPYLYTLFEECHRTGAPLLRPLFWANAEDTTTYTVEDEFLCGNALLVAPITRPGTEYRHVYLPEGVWFHFWTAERFEGPAHILAHAPLGQPIFYVRANTVVPFGPNSNYVGEQSIDPLTLVLYPASGIGRAFLYEDAGDGYEQLDGVYARRQITCESDVEANTLRVTIAAREGNFVPAREHLRLELREIASSPNNVWLGETPARWYYSLEQRSVIIDLEEVIDAQTIDIAL